MRDVPRAHQLIAPDVKLGRDVRIFGFVNLYGCEIGDETKIGSFVEIQKNARIGARCKISSHSFICEGVTLEDEVFIGHGVSFINGSYRVFGNGGVPLNGANPNANLASASDHYPVVADYRIPAKMSVAIASVPSQVIVGAKADAIAPVARIRTSNP